MDMRAFNEDVVRRFRAGDDIDGLDRDRLVLLTTVGRRTGRSQTTPMMFLDDGDALLVIASNNGAVQHPAWLLNLQAHPQVVVETPSGVRSAATAEVLQGQQRRTRWEGLVEAVPFFIEHQERAGERGIPLVHLHLAD